ncbi:MAG TPA: EAL domain-containing protein [Vicinamibacteria bacterium]|nr:EAL domain-containing protein [Vicinamibacteria bacterium]
MKRRPSSSKPRQGDVSPATSAELDGVKCACEGMRLLTGFLPAMLWSTDTDLRITSSRGAGLEPQGLQPCQAVGRTLYEYFDTADSAFPPIAAHLRALGGEDVDFAFTWQGRAFQTHVEPFRGPSSELRGAVGVAVDITEQRCAEEKLHHVARHDALTGLPNRPFLLERLQHALAGLQQGRQPFALLLLRLDRFRAINDSLGHITGDWILSAIARRLESAVRPPDLVARFGGDGFAVLIDQVENGQEAAIRGRRVQEALAEPFLFGGRELVTTASMGIALASRAHLRPEDILRDADTALRRARALGRARFEVFDDAMHEREVALLETEMELRRALERGEFQLHYQPIVALGDGNIAGFEGLVRWRHPERGLLPPADFLSVAEETGLILAIDRWVLEEGCRQTQAWSAEHLRERPLELSVNLSGKDLLQRDLVDQVQAALRTTGMEARHLRLEITEGVLLEDAASAGATLSRIRDLAVEVSIDDFGTGYSSLSHLHNLPVNHLKIDRCFVSEMDRRPQQREIVRTIVTLAHRLGMDVVAEGVETQDQLWRLQTMGCDYAQGFLFSGPVDAQAARRLLDADTLIQPRKRRSRPAAIQRDDDVHEV